MTRNTDKVGLRFAGKSAALFVAAITASIGAVTSAAAQTPSESLVYSFAGGTSDGAKPLAGLYIDSSNNLYGATYSGGLYGQGTVFEFASGATGDTILCNLPGGYDTGSHPGAGAWGTPVVYSGTVYGTATYNTVTSSSVSGDGVIYKCAPSGTAYTYTNITTFSGSNGANPFAGVVIDSGGTNLYGTTANGGSSSDGIIFKQLVSGGAPTTLYNFTGSGSTGYYPFGGVVLNSSSGSILYGTALEGGTSSNGTVYVGSTSMGTPAPAYGFASSSYGYLPRGGVVADTYGDLFGTTSLGGSGGNGVVFELTALGGGRYTPSILHTFAGSNDGAQPWASLYRNTTTGNLYGTTTSGGMSGYGTVFELASGSSGYTYSVLWNFAGGTSDGANPYGPLAMDSSGNLYGTTANGGANGHGAIFKITP